jgi:hypothetical protein
MARLSNARQRHSKRDEFPRVMRKFWQRPDENLMRARTWVASIANSATVLLRSSRSAPGAARQADHSVIAAVVRQGHWSLAPGRLLADLLVF